MKSSYDILGVAAGANSEEIRAAYLRRVKVLHPDRFDQIRQPDEWQMANDMLKELNDAYAGLSSGEHSTNRVHEKDNQTETQIIVCDKCNTKNLTPRSRRGAKCGRCGAELPIHSGAEAPKANFETTQLYWNHLGEIILAHLKALNEVVLLENDNFDVHLLSLENYVSMNFKCQLQMATLEVNHVNPSASTFGIVAQDVLSQYSSLVTRRVSLVTRARHLKEKYPYWQTLWFGYDGLGISTAEFEQDNIDWKNTDPELISIGDDLISLDARLKSSIEVTAMELLAKFGERFAI